MQLFFQIDLSLQMLHLCLQEVDLFNKLRIILTCSGRDIGNLCLVILESLYLSSEHVFSFFVLFHIFDHIVNFSSVFVLNSFPSFMSFIAVLLNIAQVDLQLVILIKDLLMDVSKLVVLEGQLRKVVVQSVDLIEIFLVIGVVLGLLSLQMFESLPKFIVLESQ